MKIKQSEIEKFKEIREAIKIDRERPDFDEMNWFNFLYTQATEKNNGQIDKKRQKKD